MKTTTVPRSRKAISPSPSRRKPVTARPRTAPASADVTDASDATQAIELIEDQPDPDIPEAEALEQARRMVVNATPLITQGIIRQAKLGSYVHARMLFDFAGLTAAQPPESATMSPVLELLLKQMDTPFPKLAAS